ncbi:MAG: cytidine deaminase [Paludibacteraceae bacterium]|nr:cytidine deaminase [Paludibacteraceae bacterium]
MKTQDIHTTFQSCQWDDLTVEQQTLVERAKQMTFQSYCPYSHFNVGAAALLADGTIVTGSNQENAAYPSGLCAERTTLFAANANHPDTPVKTLAIACRTRGSFTQRPGSPCGSCRQVMIETEHRYRLPMEVILYGEQEIYIFRAAADLLPFGFFSEDLQA